MSEYHRPVMLKESLEGLAIDPHGMYVDATFGGGGHSQAILDRLSNKGRLIAFDQDPDAEANTINDPRFMLLLQNFRHLKRFLRLHGVGQVDGILADLGISSHQIDTAERGFSTRFEGDLDMRMGQQGELTAFYVINSYLPDQLSQVLKTYGEIPNAQRVANAIVEIREQAPIKTTRQLTSILAPLAKGKPAKYFAQVFQALRIEVNQEIAALKEFLIQSSEVLKEGGRLVVIAYHSLEDRLVKNYIKKGVFDGEAVKDFYGNPLMPFKPVVGKAIRPTEEEIAKNPRARSARLRIAEKRSQP